MTNTAPHLRLETAPPLSPRDLAALSSLKSFEHYRPVGTRRVTDGIVMTTEVRSEIFTLQHTELGQLIFMVRLIKDCICDNTIPYRVFLTELTEDWYNGILRDNGIEEAHLDRLSARDLRVPPICILTDPAGGVNFIDGSHRIIRRWRCGLKSLRFILIGLNHLAERGLVMTSPPEGCSIRDIGK